MKIWCNTANISHHYVTFILLQGQKSGAHKYKQQETNYRKYGNLDKSNLISNTFFLFKKKKKIWGFIQLSKTDQSNQNEKKIFNVNFSFCFPWVIDSQLHLVQNLPVESGSQRVLQLQAHEVLTAKRKKQISSRSYKRYRCSRKHISIYLLCSKL